VENLQKFKDSPADFDYTAAEYLPLLNFDLSRFTPNPAIPEEQ
jgi:hypothetical protein